MAVGMNDGILDLGDDDKRGVIEATKRLMDHLLSKKGMELKSRLYEPEIPLLARSESMASIYGIKNLKRLNSNFKEHRVSLDGKGRDEMVKTIQSEIQRALEEEKMRMMQAQGGLFK